MNLKATTLLLGLALSAPVLAEEAKSTVAEAVAASGQVTLCNADRECEKRDTARLFFIAGKSEPALRILCDTEPVVVAFGGYNAKLEDRGMKQNIDAKNRCLHSVGLQPLAGNQ